MTQQRLAAYHKAWEAIFWILATGRRWQKLGSGPRRPVTAHGQDRPHFQAGGESALIFTKWCPAGRSLDGHHAFKGNGGEIRRFSSLLYRADASQFPKGQ